MITSAMIDKLIFCFEQNLPRRAVARVTKCDRKTALRYYKLFVADPTSLKRLAKDRGIYLSPSELLGLPETIERSTLGFLREEATSREITVPALCAAIITIVAKDNLFEAILGNEKDVPSLRSNTEKSLRRAISYDEAELSKGWRRPCARRKIRTPTVRAEERE